MKHVHVALPGRSYDIRIGASVLEDGAGHIARMFGRKRMFVVCDAHVHSLHFARLEAALLAQGLEVHALCVPAGEQSKNWRELERVTEWLLAQKVERNDVVIAFGGGVIGDLVGFSAAILRRGVRFVQIPTTLLAQVDSSVGGKTGINSPLGKNLVGAFHQPSFVLIETEFLDTLDLRVLLSGYGEVVKYGLLGDATFFEWLEGQADQIKARQSDAIIHVIERSCQMKADIVMRDETEQGERALLNLGHTFCHALEAATSYDPERLMHGEGVAIGCALALDVSARMGLCAQEDPSRLRAHLQHMGMKWHLRDIPGEIPDSEALMALMLQDKKVKDGVPRFILTRGIGEAFVCDDTDMNAVQRALDDALQGYR